MPRASTYEQFADSVSKAYPRLSKQLQQIARYVEQHRDQIGLDRIQDVAQRCEVQPSAVIRFAKRFGFSGYSEMHKIFRDGIAQQSAPSRNYQVRIRRVIEQAPSQALFAHVLVLSRWGGSRCRRQDSLTWVHVGCGQQTQGRMACSHCLQALLPRDVERPAAA